MAGTGFGLSVRPEKWIKRAFQSFLETPVGVHRRELKEAWEMSLLHGAKIQVAMEVSPLSDSGGLESRQSKRGLVGDPYGVTLSMAHDYHGASLIRQMLNIEPWY